MVESTTSFNDGNKDLCHEDIKTSWFKRSLSPVLPCNSYSKVERLRTKHIRSDSKFIRGGLVPYIEDDNNKRVYFFAVDTVYNQLTDMAGGIKFNRETFIEGSCMEACEESLFIFDYRLVQDKVVQNGTSIFSVDNSMIMTFIQVSCEDPTSIVEEYRKRRDKIETSKVLLENSALLWITEKNLIKLITFKTPRIKICSKLREASGITDLHYPVLYKEVKRRLKATLKKYGSIV